MPAKLSVMATSQVAGHVQAEAAAVMLVQMDRIAVKDVQGDEILDRVVLTEAKLNDLTGAKLSPFVQKDIIERLETLERLNNEPSAAISHAYGDGISAEVRHPPAACTNLSARAYMPPHAAGARAGIPTSAFRIILHASSH